MEPPEERAQNWLTMQSPGAAAIYGKVASEMATELEVVAEEDVAEVSRSVSRLVERVEACLVL